MNITPKLKAERARWLDTYWKTYLSGDLDTWASFIKEDYYNVGGTKEEIWHSKQEILDYRTAMMEQMMGAADFRNSRIEIQAFGDHIIVNDMLTST